MFKSGESVRNRGSSSLLRYALLATALFALLFVASGGALWHIDAPGSAGTCPICHAAHMPALPGTAGNALAFLFLVSRFDAPQSLPAHSAPATSAAPPRAPPA